MRKQELKLSARDRFQCLADKCPATCCQNMRISIDPPTLEKWEGLADREAREHLSASTAPYRVKDRDEVDFRRREDGTCIFLSPDKLCTLQQRHGHEFLPWMCRTFPRIDLETSWKRLTSLELACPEVVRLALFEDKDSSVFDAESRRVRGAGAQMGSSSPAQRLDAFIEAVLQSKKFPVSVKALAISRMLTELSLVTNQVRIDKKKLNDVFKGVSGKLYQLNLAVKQGKLKPVPLTRGSFWRAIFRLSLMDDTLAKGFDLRETAWHRMISECKDLPDDDDYLRVDRAFAACVESSRTLLHDRFGQVFDRYSTMLFVQVGMPRRKFGRNSQLAVFVQHIWKLAYIQLVCLIKQHETGSLDDEFLRDLIYTTERRVGDMVYANLEANPNWLNLHRYQSCFVDFF